MVDGPVGAGSGEQFPEVGLGVVGHDGFDADPVGGEVVDGCFQEAAT